MRRANASTRNEIVYIGRNNDEVSFNFPVKQFQAAFELHSQAANLGRLIG